MNIRDTYREARRRDDQRGGGPGADTAFPEAGKPPGGASALGTGALLVAAALVVARRLFYGRGGVFVGR